MALSPTLCDREQAKFVEDPSGNTAVRSVVTSTIPNSPTLRSVTPGDTQNIVAWEEVDDVTDYVVVFNTSGSVELTDTQIVTGSTQLFYEHTGLTNGVTYYYRVYAVGPWGDTALSVNELSGVPATFVSGVSALFDGIDEYVNFGNNHNFERNDAFSLSLWIKPTNLSGTRKTMWAKATNDANVEGYAWNLETDGSLFLQVRPTGGVYKSHFFGGTLVAGTWYHVVLTYTGSSNMTGFRAYIDASVLSTPANNALTGTLLVSEPSLIATRNAALPLNANIDEVTFWDVALDQTEVTELYNSGTPGDPTLHSQTANLLHWYTMGDGCLFPVISDSKGTVDGAMINMEAGDLVADSPP